ncbi:hypothetical protein L2E82_10703 [Cichorium intybus]|uniref:Uncharacterized protein n=1 Tax=Cichorium intybus TaxID=13427 RepID=A0ACB9GCA3_CICIN|nr:hypothetical protein L2E82_10703 [Cichorium intybus]
MYHPSLVSLLLSPLSRLISSFAFNLEYNSLLGETDSWSQPYRRGHPPALLLAGDNTDPPPFSHLSVFWETRTPPETCIHRASNTTLVVEGLGCGLPEEQSLPRIFSWQFDQQVVLRGESPLPSLNLSS